jgi:hypothetical protein
MSDHKLNALGIPSRIVGLKVADAETRKSGAGHCVIEAYVKNLSKWVMVDGQVNAIPTLKGIPLNAIEFQQALAQNEAELTVDFLFMEGTPLYNITYTHSVQLFYQQPGKS